MTKKEVHWSINEKNQNFNKQSSLDDISESPYKITKNKKLKGYTLYEFFEHQKSLDEKKNINTEASVRGSK